MNDVTAPILKVDDVKVWFDVKEPGAWPWTKPRKLKAVAARRWASSANPAAASPRWRAR